MSIRRVSILSLAVCHWALAALVSAQAIDASAAGGKVKAIASISILQDLVQNVGGNDVEVTALIGPGGDPHEYQPLPADSLKLAEAAVIFENGCGLESWLSKLADSAQTKAVRVVVTQGIDVRHLPEGERANRSDEAGDPHAWQNVKNAVVMVDDIRDALVKLDPAHASGYQSRADAYDKQLMTLDAAIEKEIESLPPQRRKLVTSHDSFGYFGQRYGLDISRSVLQSVTTEAADPSARQIAQVIDAIKASQVPVIFLENTQNPKLIDRIAAEANVKVGPPLYSDALGMPGSSGDTYLKMMRYNADTLVNALKP